MKYDRLIPLILAGCLLLSACGEDIADISTQSAPEAGAEYIETLTPKNDFYGYVNAADLMEMDLDGNDAVGTLFSLDIEVKEQLDGIIDDVAASGEAYAPGSNEQLIRDLYHQVYDFYENGDTTDAAAVQLTDGIVARIDAVSTVEELYDLWADLANDYGIFPVFTCNSDQNLYDVSEPVLMIGCSFPANLDDMKKSDVRATVYRDSFVARFKRLGMSEEEAKRRANELMYVFFEIAGHTDLAYYIGEKEYEECFRLYTEAEIKEVMGAALFDGTVGRLGIPEGTLEHYAIMDEDQLRTTAALIDPEHLQVWKDCTVMSLMDQSDAFLPGKYNMSDPPEASSERLARYYVKMFLQEELSELYAERCFDESKRSYVKEMCEEIRNEYYDLIRGADWMTQEGRDILCRKLDTMQFYIGCGEPRAVFPEDENVIGETLLETFYNLQKRNVDRTRRALINKETMDPFDVMYPSTVNACYLPSGNYIIITAAFLNEPAFDMNAGRAVNLGTVGDCIAHEISHAFDSKGVNFDEKGNYDPGRMPEADMQAFRERQDRVAEYYNGFTVLSSHVSGRKTLGENLADLSAMQCILAIADGPDEQRVLLESYAKYWMTLRLDTSAKERLKDNPHAPESVRVNAVVSCFDEYYEIYDVQPGDPMYVAPEDRVRRW